MNSFTVACFSNPIIANPTEQQVGPTPSHPWVGATGALGTGGRNSAKVLSAIALRPLRSGSCAGLYAGKTRRLTHHRIRSGPNARGTQRSSAAEGLFSNSNPRKHPVDPNLPAARVPIVTATQSPFRKLVRTCRLQLGNQHGNSRHSADDLCLLGIAKGADWNR